MNLPADDKLLQETCETIVKSAAQAIDAEPAARAVSLRVPGGQMVGKQILIDASEKGNAHNICRLAIMNADISPEGEVARIEYEHDKQTKFGIQRVYSIQSVRRRSGELVLLENFLADSPSEVREQDFRPISSESYARATVLKTLEDWTRYRAWQLQEAGKNGK
jgi:hypothetical protein